MRPRACISACVAMCERGQVAQQLDQRKCLLDDYSARRNIYTLMAHAGLRSLMIVQFSLPKALIMLGRVATYCLTINGERTSGKMGAAERRRGQRGQMTSGQALRQTVHLV